MLAEWQRIWPHLAYGLGFVGMAGMLGSGRLRLNAAQSECERERRGREEMEAYVRLDLRLIRNRDFKTLGNKVCSVIAARSPFSRVAMLRFEDEDRISLVASEGMDRDATRAIERWSELICERKHTGEDPWQEGIAIGLDSKVISLDQKASCAVVIPLKLANERVAGALLVYADSILQVPRRRAEEAIAGLEALATKLGRAMEDFDLLSRPSRTEKPTGKITFLPHPPTQRRENMETPDPAPIGGIGTSTGFAAEVSSLRPY